MDPGFDRGNGRRVGNHTRHRRLASSLKRLGMRYREPYQTRHTYASLQLMEGVNAVYIARQMGHAKEQMLFKVYGRWIDGADKSRERDRASAAFRHDTATRSAESHKNSVKSNI